MLERIVVAFDGSGQSRAAAALAFELGRRRRGARLTLVHALELPPRFPDTEEVAPATERLIELTEEDWRWRLAELAAEAPAEVSVHTAVIRAERAARGLLELLESRGGDVLAVGTHGVGGLKCLLLGSVSQQLLEHAPCSVLLVRDVPNLSWPRTVVAAVDGSETSSSVVATAQAAATALSAQLVLAHVADGVNRALREFARERGRQILERARAQVVAPLETVVDELREGATRDEFVGLCEERDPILAVIGSRGMHGFKGLLGGSTAQHLVNHAPCPVLVVRGEHAATTARASWDAGT
jgi:nucleotide-binding universal stress UspA family protein